MKFNSNPPDFPCFFRYWQKNVKTWLNQPQRNIRRRVHRQEKAKKLFPRPTAGFNNFNLLLFYYKFWLFEINFR